MSGEDLQPGDIVADQYRIERLVGSGGFARVYRARQLELDRLVALKVLSPKTDERKSPPDHVRKRFYREARLISRLQAPHTVTVYEYDVLEGGKLYMALEYIDGTDLDEVIEAEAPLSPGRVTHILGQILKALGAAHAQGVLHRDIKPTNVMIFERFGETDCVKLLDFGIAKSVMAEEQMDQNLTLEGAVVGTPRYMSPEQLQGRPLTPASDLFSAGLLLWEMYTGSSPFETHDVNAIFRRMQKFGEDLGPLEDAPPPLDEVARRLLDPSLETRYAEAGDVLEDLLAERRSGDQASGVVERVAAGGLAAPASSRARAGSGADSSPDVGETVSFPLGLDPAGTTPSTELTGIAYHDETTVAIEPPTRGSDDGPPGSGPPPPDRPEEGEGSEGSESDGAESAGSESAEQGRSRAVPSTQTPPAGLEERGPLFYVALGIFIAACAGVGLWMVVGSGNESAGGEPQPGASADGAVGEGETESASGDPTESAVAESPTLDRATEAAHRHLSAAVDTARSRAEATGAEAPESKGRESASEPAGSPSRDPGVRSQPPAASSGSEEPEPAEEPAGTSERSGEQGVEEEGPEEQGSDEKRGPDFEIEPLE